MFEARITIEKVSALANESAIGHNLDSYLEALSTGDVWPKPAFATIRDEDRDEQIPGWANGAAFGAVVDRSKPYPRVLVSYAASGQSSTGSGFNSRVANVLVCVSIEVEFVGDRVDLYQTPEIAGVDCPADVQKYFGGDEVVTFEEVFAASPSR